MCMYISIAEHFKHPIDALMAAHALPGIFPVVKSDRGEAFVSGAVKVNLPVIQAVSKCIELGYEDVEVTGMSQVISPLLQTFHVYAHYCHIT